MPTTVSEHIFFHSRNGLTTICARFGIDVTNYVTKHATKIKAKISYNDLNTFHEPVIKPGIPEKQRIANQ